MRVYIITVQRADEVLRVLQLLLPHLLVKRKQAEIAIALCKRITTRRGRSRVGKAQFLSPHEREIRLCLYAAIKDCNHARKPNLGALKEAA